jgi:hypothetical protein
LIGGENQQIQLKILMLVVPMTGDRSLAIADLTVVLEPTASNGCMKVSYLLP